ncbi:hypothetical protein KKC44_02260 [Patescibacteria group bacterium]|nr:hypothetical protein [Patescibacteria group bacterium]MBU2259407.1 hypothetical protein [Patescibacteria group bacterium]
MSRRSLNNLRENGHIFRGDGGVYNQVLAKEDSHLRALEGVEVNNDFEVPDGEVLFQKFFPKKRIYLQREYEKAVRIHLKGKDQVVVGMNGYSSLSEEQCRDWGVQPGHYEAVCRRIIRELLKCERDFRGMKIHLAHGASDMGVDKAIIDEARSVNQPMLGFSCPQYMMYVEDDDVPVQVARTVDEYSHNFCNSLDILLTANGRKQTFNMDITAAFTYGKHVIPLNVLEAISDTGGPPAIDRDGKIQDAVALLYKRMHLLGMRPGFDASPDPVENLINELSATTRSICRLMISPEPAYLSQ